jgi:hypothetical protein
MQPRTERRPSGDASGLEVHSQYMTDSSFHAAGMSPQGVRSPALRTPGAGARILEGHVHMPQQRVASGVAAQAGHAQSPEWSRSRDSDGGAVPCNPSEHGSGGGAQHGALGASTSTGSSALRSQLSLSDVHMTNGVEDPSYSGATHGDAQAALTRSNVALHRPRPETRTCAGARELLEALAEEPLPENATNAELLAALEDSALAEESLEHACASMHGHGLYATTGMGLQPGCA